MTKITLIPTASLLIALAACSVPSGTSPAARNAAAPGWTGRTTVLGNNSSVAGDAVATTDVQQGMFGGRQR